MHIWLSKFHKATTATRPMAVRLAKVFTPLESAPLEFDEVCEELKQM